MNTDVLLIEDDPDIRETMRDLLDESGYRVATAKNGREALVMLEEGASPSVILLDLLMPVMDGTEFIVHLHRDERIARIPVLVLSASTLATPPPGTTLLRKPLTIADLLQAIERAKLATAASL